MNENQEHKERVVNSLVGEAEQRSAEREAKAQNVQIKVIDGEVFLSSMGLITQFELNMKRKGLSKAEKGIFQRVVDTLKQYHGHGLAIAMDEVFQTGDVVWYKGGQSIADRLQLQKEKDYYVSAVTSGHFPGPNGGAWKSCVYLAGIDGPPEAPEKVPAFLASLFMKKPKDAESTSPKVVSMGISRQADAPPSDDQTLKNENDEGTSEGS